MSLWSRSRSNGTNGKPLVQEAMDELSHLCSDSGIKCEIQGRPKSFYNIYKKMQKDNKSINGNL